MASLGTLAAGVAHEINNPLSYVLGSLDLGLRELHGLQQLLQGHPNEELEHISGAVAALDSAREGAERVRNIVRDLMDFSRADAWGQRARSMSRRFWTRRSASPGTRFDIARA